MRAKLRYNDSRKQTNSPRNIMRNRDNMPGDWLFKVVPIFIGSVFVMMIGYFIFIGFIAYKAIDTVGDQDFSNGLKPVIEKVWCGKPGCLDEKK